MITTEPRFWDHLRQSGLLADDAISSLQCRFAAETPIDNIKSTLIGEGLLTGFQAKRVAAGDTRHLVLGQYRVVDEIGRGGFACVYKATHAFMNRTVAIKLITPELAEDSRARTWFEREVHAVTQLCHPNIVMAYDANEIDDLFFMVMEFVDGMNLEAVVKHHGPMSALNACEMLQQAARGLQYAHEKGLVHRDIKPANLLVPRPEANQSSAETVLVKIADFGLARLYNNPANTLVLRNDKCFVGTPDYIAPEQARKVHEADIRSDLYSLGCSFFFALTGQRPFRGDNALETVMMHMEKEPTPLARLRPDLPPALTAVIHKLMAKDPAKRFQTPAELASELAFVMTRESSPELSRIKKTDRFPTIRPKTSIGEFQPTTVVDLSAASSCSPLPGTPERWVGGKGTNEQEESVHRQENLLPTNSPTPNSPLTPKPSPRITGERGELTDSDAALTHFDEHWRQWTSVIESLVNGSAANLNPQQYRALHTELLGAARALTKSTTADRQPVFARVETLLRPWLSLQSLTSIDRQTLLSLQARCLQVSQQLGVTATRQWTWPFVFVACALTAAVAGYILQGTAWTSSANANGVQNFVESNPIICLALIIPLAVVGSIFTFGRFFRRP